MEFVAQTTTITTTSSDATIAAVARGPLASLAPHQLRGGADHPTGTAKAIPLTVSGLLEAEISDSSPGVSPDRRSISPLVCDVTAENSADLSVGMSAGQQSPASLRAVPCAAFRVAVVNAVDLQPPTPEGTPNSSQQVSVSQFTALPKYVAAHLLADSVSAGAATTTPTAAGITPAVEKRLGWAHTATRTGRNPEWDAASGSVIVPLPSEYTGTATLEIAVYGKLNAEEETYDDLFLGHGFVKLDAYATEPLTFRVFLGRGDLGRSTHAHGAEQQHGRSSYVVVRVTALRSAAAVVPDEFLRDAQHPINKAHPSLRVAAHSSSSSSMTAHSVVQSHRLQRRRVTSVVHTEEHSYLKSGFALEVTVKEAKDLNPNDGLHMGELFVALRLGGLSFRTNVVEGASASAEQTQGEGEGKNAQWNETFLVHLPALGPSVMDVAFYQAGASNRPIGAGAVDLLALPWERADTIECQVRLRLRGQLAGVLLVTLKQVPAGCVLRWREILTERVRIEERWSLFLSEIHAEEAHQRRCLLSAWESVCRMHLWNREESLWAVTVHEYRSWMEWVRVQTSLRCTLSVTVVEASGLSSAGRIRVSALLGHQQNQHCQTAMIRGTNCPRWREEFQLVAPGCLYYGSKVLNLPLRIEVWDVDKPATSEGCLGIAEVPLLELCHRETYDLVLHLATGGYLCVALCALDFGLPAEDPRLVVRVVRATDLPLRKATGDHHSAQPKPAVAARLAYPEDAAAAAEAIDATRRRPANQQSTDVTWTDAKAAARSAEEEQQQAAAVEDLEGWAVTSSTVRGTNPVWNEEFVLPVRRPEAAGGADLVLPSRLELKVFDTEGGARDLMGSIAMQLQGLVRNQPYAYRLWLTVTTSGTVEQNSCVVVELCAKGFGLIQLPSSSSSSTATAAVSTTTANGGGAASTTASANSSPTFASLAPASLNAATVAAASAQHQHTVTTTTTTTTGRPSQ